jgi:hypothetical protein
MSWSRLIDRVRPHDVIAVITMIGCFAILAMGETPTASIMWTLSTVVGFYFGRQTALGLCRRCGMRTEERDE